MRVLRYAQQNSFRLNKALAVGDHTDEATVKSETSCTSAVGSWLKQV